MDKYIEVIGKRLVPYINEVGPDMISRQDRAPCLTSKKSKEWLSKQDIEVINWPGNSPDLNPFENFWLVVEIEFAKFKPKNRQKNDFIGVRECKYENTQSQLRRLAIYAIRIEKILKNKGNPTKY